jgi:hypothetical protein
MAIKENLLKVRKRISLVCSKINCDPNSITIVAVSKGRTVEQIHEAVNAGIADIGENKVQEALIKYNKLRTQELANLRTIKWHMVGHLQTNKVKDALKIFDLIQSVDSLHLALAINKEAASINKIQDILIEVKTSPEVTKFGLKAADTIEVIKEISKLRNINIKGLMTIAPIVDNPKEASPYFKILKELLDEINGLRITDYGLRVLSMGMTDDFEAAIEEGANMIRLGRAIFEG